VGEAGRPRELVLRLHVLIQVGLGLVVCACGVLLAGHAEAILRLRKRILRLVRVFRVQCCLARHVHALVVEAGSRQFLRLLQVDAEKVIQRPHRVTIAALLESEAVFAVVLVGARRYRLHRRLQDLVHIHFLHAVARNAERVLGGGAEVAPVAVDRRGAVQLLRAVEVLRREARLARVEALPCVGAVLVAELALYFVAKGFRVRAGRRKARLFRECELLFRAARVDKESKVVAFFHTHLLSHKGCLSLQKRALNQNQYAAGPVASAGSASAGPVASAAGSTSAGPVASSSPASAAAAACSSLSKTSGAGFIVL